MTALVDMLSTQMELGECPLWDHRHGRLYWVDIIRCTLFERDWASGALRTWPLPALGGGLGLLGADDLIVAAQTGLFRFSPHTGRYHFLLHPEPGMPSNRLNEGKTDDAGNFWIGSISTLRRRPEGALYRVSAGGHVRQVLSEVHVPNALVFLPDNQLLFSDSHLKTIWRFRFDLDDGTLSERQVFVDDRALPSIPDGAVLAQDGTIWNAKFGGGRVAVYDRFGKIVSEIRLPVSQVTSCAFAGPELNHLVVTTAKRLLDDDQRRSQTESGNLFIFKTDVSGRREPVCRL
ncbi:SMP-30/gluconolactonase/LRE family protein [Mesorhizobium sp. LMG 17147]|uniref:SMP-30/gluconolactonase/LRE family protein n=1 Tax=Mesorhizobium sp. LMG 17147 TaxID=2963091 RepID=UPI0020C96777|nr:SMP-30/gluconolactonase/LRE family protein [Mesorhizobium sp. LMG 17147]MCP9233369.1 SMP-30/gluconolactonase/LRE family protein [Mesorhizobium sp. LMG 17147]